MERVTENRRKDPAKTCECLRVRCSRCSGAHDLRNRRQVQTDDAVFENEDALLAEQSRRNGPERSKEKGSCPVCRFLAEIPMNLCPDRNVEQTISAKPVSQLIDKMPLDAGNLGGRPMADERDFSPGNREFFDSPSEENPCRLKTG